MTDRYQMDGPGWRLAKPSQAIVLHPIVKVKGERLKDPESRLKEAIGLARAIALNVVHSEAINISKIQPATLIGTGAGDRFHDLIESMGVDLVIMDINLSPIQQRNLERLWNVKVIDRTGLILEIFGRRARTYEGRLQVELAAMNFQRSRLVRSWTHLERQRGGLGFIGGPGESQLEIDRRLIDERIAKLKRHLQGVKKTRQLQRNSRKKVPYPVVALVGYTNAGKSTLFNHLTDAGVMAKDLLFATLDPTMRQVSLPSGRKVILSDTVGFISDLPTDLIAAFRATLEEVCEADVVIHVRDIASAQSEDQKQDVLNILENLKLSNTTDQIEALNKIDILDHDRRKKLLEFYNQSTNQIGISAANGENCAELMNRVDRLLSATNETLEVTLSPSDGKLLAWVYENGDVLQRHDDANSGDIRLAISFDPKNVGRLKAMQKAKG